MTPGMRSTILDFARRVRPQSDCAISQTGTNAAGALLP